MNDFIKNHGWKFIEKLRINPKEKQNVPYDDLQLTGFSKKYLNSFVPEGIYLHQRESIKSFLGGDNVCLSTGTASGKSLSFFIAGIETLAKEPNSRVLAIYPLKALGREQENRWQEALQKANLEVKVGRIDGQIPLNQRISILKKCRIVIITPDVIHAWLFSNLSNTTVVSFIQSIKLLVVDEIHTYAGVFGSNSAFLFRRLRHLLSLCNIKPQFICASATIAKPENHLNSLFGLPFKLIGQEYDTSPKHQVDIILFEPPKNVDFLTEVSKFLKELSKGSEKFIAFVDSRKQTELISSILSRREMTDDDEAAVTFENSHLNYLNILPYRAGYEEQDREIIQSRLSSGLLKGVISTSALELGLDIPFLDIAILLGVPNSSTSLFQRIGRIGRHSKGTVYVIHSGSFVDEVIFRNPSSLLKRPLAETALYLQNKRIQYIHALCLARSGGEHDQFCNIINQITNEDSFSSSIDWPSNFTNLCKAEIIGEVPQDLQSIKLEAADDPNHVYPLRDVESQFKVQLKQGPEQRELGSLSYSQLLREAYPGAVYYYTTNSYRVYRVSIQSKTVFVRSEKKYTTSPNFIPTQVYPNLSAGNVYTARRHADLIVFESNIQVRQSINGFKERRGSNSISVLYPLSRLTSTFYDRPRFNRNYFTSGVVFTHPQFNNDHIKLETIAKLIYEAFLISIPFERQDIDFAIGKHKIDRLPYVSEGDRFITIFDNTYGSLRLSGYVMEENFMLKVLQQAHDIANLGETIEEINDNGEISPVILEVLNELILSAKSPGKAFSFESNDIISEDNQKILERIIMPGSIGLALNKNNEEFLVENVFFHPKLSGLCYRGKYTDAQDNVDIVIQVSNLVEIPGESKIGFYNYDTGDVECIKF